MSSVSIAGMSKERGSTIFRFLTKAGNKVAKVLKSKGFTKFGNALGSIMSALKAKIRRKM